VVMLLLLRRRDNCLMTADFSGTCISLLNVHLLYLTFLYNLVLSTSSMADAFQHGNLSIRWLMLCSVYNWSLLFESRLRERSVTSKFTYGGQGFGLLFGTRLVLLRALNSLLWIRLP